MNTLSQVFPPGEFLKDELEARTWSQTEFAEIIGRPVRLVNEIIAGKKMITPETAVQLGVALGTGPDFWLNLESQYQLSRISRTDDLVARRARVYQFPVREMANRGWIRKSGDVEELEKEITHFFGIDDLNDEILFRHAPKKTDGSEVPTKLQLAWLFRARQIAVEMSVPQYSREKLEAVLSRLVALRSTPEEIKGVSSLLSECGIRFVIVEAIPRSKIDGACFWLENGQPVVSMSLRLDRIDNFWFVLRHELEHVRQGHGKDRGFILEDDVQGNTETKQSAEEITANLAAADFCVSQSELTQFLSQVGTRVSSEQIVLFAQQLKVHPGLVVGQIQHRLDRYDLFRKFQVKVRSLVTISACTDGHGKSNVAPASNEISRFDGCVL
jgi:HTH-type transcriptional regulator / antitoxin HigA